jgi:uncharacterized protein YndB with AHSA1/START domain
MADAGLGRFIDRHTVEYLREYAHPIERVWRAITDPAEFSVWFIRGQLDPRPGGAYRFETRDDGFKGLVVEIDPPRFIRFGGPAHENGWFSYELTPSAAGTRMRFVQFFPPEGHYAATPDDLGGDLPVPGTPWKPGFLGGWHEFWDALGDHLDGVPVGSRLPPTEFSALAEAWVKDVQGSRMTPEAGARIVAGLRRKERWNELNKVYRAHILATLRPEES